MHNKKDYNLGIMYRREHAPEDLPDFSRHAEASGFDELWVVEDCFYGSGFASAATALSLTDSIKVGLGIMPAVARNPVFTAMEIATVSRLFPDRFLPGIGHGVAGWMHQIGAFPKSQLKALEEVTISVRKLLKGEGFSFDGEHIQLDEVSLIHPPEHIPPISLGVRGPKSLALSGRVADGTILAEYAGPAYVSWARQQIESGQKEAGQEGHHHLTVFAWACAEADVNKARQQMRPLIASAIASGKLDSQLAPLNILPQAKELLESGGHERLEAAMPDDWIDQLAIVGSPEDWEVSIHRLVEAGADTIVLVPLPDKGLNEVDVFAQHFLG